MNVSAAASIGGSVSKISKNDTINNGPISIEGLRAEAADNKTERADFDSFWVQEEVEAYRWDRMFPYQFLIVEARGEDYVLTGDRFTLPVPPEAYSISMPFAIQARATLGGIVEEHNGAPFRMINLRGTTGFLPDRGKAPSQDGFNPLQAAFGGTIQRLNTITADFSATIAAATNKSPQNPNVHIEDDFKEAYDLFKTSGYHQFRMLQRFFEKYAAVKKTKAGHNLRLAFAVWKDQAVYLVTPQTFEVSKNTGSPLEYQYSISLKAWRRVRLKATTSGAFNGTVKRRSPNFLAAALTTIQNARRVIQGANALPAAIIGDVRHLILDPLRQTALFCKDALGLGMTLADIPMTDGPFAVAWRQSAAEFQTLVNGVRADAAALNNKVKRNLGQKNEFDRTLPTQTSARGRLSKAHPSLTPFLKPDDANFDYLNGIDVSSLRLTPELKKAADDERQKAAALKPSFFSDARDAMNQAAAAISRAVGAGHPTVDATYGLSGDIKKAEPSLADWSAMFALNAAAEVLDGLAASAPEEDSARNLKIVAMQGLARKSGIAFQTPVSKFAIPFPYGATLESLALQYLGDPNRWNEIAALNGLRSPYIDEVGFDLYLVTNGEGSQVVVPKSNYLYVGQVVYIWSQGARRTSRTITSIREVGDNLVLDLDGSQDMDSYRVNESAKLSAFLPDTVNSQGLIYIPSQDAAADTGAVTKSIPGVNEFDPMIAVGGVDLLLDSDNDLVITPDGDTRWSTGLANIIQDTRIQIGTKKGSLLQHQSFGLAVDVGMSTAEADLRSISAEIKKSLAANPDFSRVDAVEIRKNGPSMDINISVVVSGTERPVPISYGVRGDFQTA
jgi:hypothetical protein